MMLGKLEITGGEGYTAKDGGNERWLGCGRSRVIRGGQGTCVNNTYRASHSQYQLLIDKTGRPAGMR